MTDASAPMAQVVHLTTVHVPTDNRIAMKECAALVRAGVSVCLIATGGPAPEVEGLDFVSLPTRIGRIGRLLRGNIDAWRALRVKHPRVVHVHDPELIPLAALYRTWFGVRAIYDAHEEFGKQIRGKKYIPRPLRLPAALLGHLLEELADRTLDRVVVATEEVGLRYTGTKVTLVQNYPWRETFDVTFRPSPPDPQVIAYVGAISGDRGIAEMIEAVKGCAPGVRLVLAGPASAEAKEIIDRAPPERVEYVGALPSADVPGVISRAAVGLAVLRPLRNYLRSQPTKVYEYMAAGRPFIASDFEYWVEMFGPSDSGLFVDPVDTEQLRHAIDRLTANPELAQAMGRRGRTEFLSRFTFDNEAVRLVELTRTLLQKDQQRSHPGRRYPDPPA